MTPQEHIDTLRYLGFDPEKDFTAALVDDALVIRWMSAQPQPTPDEIEAARPAAEAAAAAKAAEEARQKADQKELRDQFQQAADILDQIINAPSMTQAQAVAAIRQLATIQKRVLKAIYPLMTA